jgi:hypothetical protein
MSVAAVLADVLYTSCKEKKNADNFEMAKIML